jgi:hypothetical protein
MKNKMKTTIFFLIAICSAFTSFAQLPTEPLLFTDSELQKLTFDDIPGRKIDSIDSDVLWDKWLAVNARDIKDENGNSTGIIITGNSYDSTTRKSIINEEGVTPRHRSLYENPVDLLKEARVSFVGNRKVYHLAIESKGADAIDFNSLNIKLSSTGKLFFISKDKFTIFNDWDKNSIENRINERNFGGLWDNTTYKLNMPTESVIIEYSEEIEETNTIIVFYEIYHRILKSEKSKIHFDKYSSKKKVETNNKISGIDAYCNENVLSCAVSANCFAKNMNVGNTNLFNSLNSA